MLETYRMLGRQREAELLREARRLHALGPSAAARVGQWFVRHLTSWAAERPYAREGRAGLARLADSIIGRKP
jgi:hypothetical protein